MVIHHQRDEPRQYHANTPKDQCIDCLPLENMTGDKAKNGGSKNLRNDYKEVEYPHVYTHFF